MARAPFYLGLIAEFGSKHQRLPKTQTELFEAYVLARLGGDAHSIDKLTDPALIALVHAAEEIGHFLLTSRFGLEAPLAALQTEFPSLDITAAISRLTDARIMRTGRPPSFICSFAHRRIQEYFVIRHMLRTGEPFNHEWVALDSSRRDGAVLYVELASEEEAEKIAQLCWQDIIACPPDNINYGSREFWRALHCQRFLTEAFRVRPEALDAYREDLAKRALSTLQAAPNYHGRLAMQSHDDRFRDIGFEREVQGSRLDNG